MVTRSKKLKSETDQSTTGDGVFELVYAWVVQIPSGRVMTYGQISRLIDERLSAVGVGWAL
ncbi:MAG TPA: MGMT family protein, partial [Acidobacteriota bacterium]|nr:MGMT family protein [Acidobacteriota bacterium]